MLPQKITPLTSKPRELFKLFSLPRAPTRRIYLFGMKRSLSYSKLDQNRKMQHKQKKCAVCSEGENFQQVLVFFFCTSIEQRNTDEASELGCCLWCKCWLFQDVICDYRQGSMPKQAVQQKIEGKIADGRVRYFEAWIESALGLLLYFKLSLQCRSNLLVLDITTRTASLETYGDS